MEQSDNPPTIKEIILSHKDLLLTVKRDYFDYVPEEMRRDTMYRVLINNYEYLVGRGFMTHDEHLQLFKKCHQKGDWRELAIKYYQSVVDNPLIDDRVRHGNEVMLRGTKKRPKERSSSMGMIGGASDDNIGEALSQSGLSTAEIYEFLENN